MPKIKVNGIIKSITPCKKRTAVEGIDSAKEYLKELQSGLSRTMLLQESNQNLDDLNEAIREDTGPIVHRCGNSDKDYSNICALIDELKREERNYEQNKTGLSEITSEKVVQPNLIGRS